MIFLLGAGIVLLVFLALRDIRVAFGPGDTPAHASIASRLLYGVLILGVLLLALRLFATSDYNDDGDGLPILLPAEERATPQQESPWRATRNGLEERGEQ